MKFLEYKNLKVKSTMLIFGCSSAKMSFEQSEPFGCVLELLLKQCPTYMGFLWNVTDLDIDSITYYLMTDKGNGDLSALLR